MQTREQTLNAWLTEIFAHQPYQIKPLAGDASFRRYFRVHAHQETFILMDAPPEKEPLQPFLQVQTLLEQHEIQVPHCVESNIDDGFLLLTDFGDQLLLHQMTPATATQTYQQALDLVQKLQAIPLHCIEALPAFNAHHMLQELTIFQEWFLQHYLKLNLSHAERALLQHEFNELIQAIEQQPLVLIHRDYHSRNLMRLADHSLGLIDFQDAMIGPLGYDLVSLLKDCYIHWPKTQWVEWLGYFHQQSKTAIDLPTLITYVELCGLQRHLKVLGIFSRLALRDNKPRYLDDLPLTLHYVMDYLKQAPSLQELHQFMQRRVSLP